MPALRMLIFLSVVKGFLSYFLVRVIVGTSLHRREVLFTQLNFQHLHEICALEVIQMIVRNRPKIPSFKCSISKVKPKSNEMPTPQHTYPPGCRRRSNTNNWRKSHWTHTPRASIRSSLVTSGLVESLGNTAYWSVFFFLCHNRTARCPRESIQPRFPARMPGKKPHLVGRLGGWLPILHQQLSAVEHIGIRISHSQSHSISVLNRHKCTQKQSRKSYVDQLALRKKKIKSSSGNM